MIEADEDDQPLAGPERRCAVTGRVAPKETLIRFVVGPEDRVVIDVDRRLPGRGIWLSPRRDVVNTAVTKRAFSRAAKRPVVAADDLADQVEAALARRGLETLALARRAGQAVCGFEKVREALSSGSLAVLVEARDGSTAGRAKLGPVPAGVAVVDLFDAAELGRMFGRDHAVHVGLAGGGLAERFSGIAALLAGFRTPSTTDVDRGPPGPP